MKKFAILILALGTLAGSAAAIPAFARKYGYSCEVCHAPVPRLKAFGEEFMDNGYRIPDKEPPRATVDTGDPTLLLQRELPLAMRFDGYLAYEPNGTSKSDVRAPLALKIVSGGNISDHISYYIYFLMAEDAKVAGLEDAYLYFHDLFGTPLSFSFGQIRITDPIKPTETRLTVENYMIYKFRVGQSRMNLAYDRGFTLGYGLDFGLDLVAEVVNGNGIEERGHLRLGQIQELRLPGGPEPLQGQAPDRRAGVHRERGGRQRPDQQRDVLRPRRAAAPPERRDPARIRAGARTRIPSSSGPSSPR